MYRRDVHLRFSIYSLKEGVLQTQQPFSFHESSLLSGHSTPKVQPKQGNYWSSNGVPSYSVACKTFSITRKKQGDFLQQSLILFFLYDIPGIPVASPWKIPSGFLKRIIRTKWEFGELSPNEEAKSILTKMNFSCVRWHIFTIEIYPVLCSHIQSKFLVWEQTPKNPTVKFSFFSFHFQLHYLQLGIWIRCKIL